MLALVKGSERYVFLFNEKNRGELLRTLGRYASNPDLNFTWYDAAVLSQKIRQETTHSSTGPVQNTALPAATPHSQRNHRNITMPKKDIR
jgi:hypothetical protein